MPGQEIGVGWRATEAEIAVGSNDVRRIGHCSEPAVDVQRRLGKALDARARARRAVADHEHT